MALIYLARFCSHHRLYGQCSAVLAAVLYVHFLNGRSISLLMPKQIRLQPQRPARFAHLEKDIIGEHGWLLPYYLTLISKCVGCAVFALQHFL
ncbi:hypothetical protein BDV26DRAFT_257326, partial [Aspergillus bertholletiae]